ncbi:UNVERIFIED_CONTAM: hypothetical protein Sindi_0383400 [Sesamum indicum]
MEKRKEKEEVGDLWKPPSLPFSSKIKSYESVAWKRMKILIQKIMYDTLSKTGYHELEPLCLEATQNGDESDRGDIANVAEGKLQGTDASGTRGTS